MLIKLYMNKFDNILNADAHDDSRWCYRSEGVARRRLFVGSRKVQCVSKFCVMVTHRRRSLMITQVSVTQCHGFFLHNERNPFIRVVMSVTRTIHQWGRQWVYIWWKWLTFFTFLHSSLWWDFSNNFLNIILTNCGLVFNSLRFTGTSLEQLSLSIIGFFFIFHR